MRGGVLWAGLWVGCGALLWSSGLTAGDMTRPGRKTSRVLRSGMVRVPAGTFLRGSPKGTHSPSEQPQRPIWLDEFWVDVHEVTTEEYRTCVNAGRCSVPVSRDTLCNWSIQKHDKHPINCVSWEQARDYCQWEGKRLPTEAEWEKAARGTDGRTYPWGEQEATCERACMAQGSWGCGDGGTCPVGSRPKGASPYGAHDMSGNVWEWTADWHADNYYKLAPARNPKGPLRGTRHAIRGGGYGMYQDGQRCANRDGGFMTHYDGGDAVGFRCAF